MKSKLYSEIESLNESKLNESSIVHSGIKKLNLEPLYKLSAVYDPRYSKRSSRTIDDTNFLVPANKKEIIKILSPIPKKNLQEKNETKFIKLKPKVKQVLNDYDKSKESNDQVEKVISQFNTHQFPEFNKEATKVAHSFRGHFGKNNSISTVIPPSDTYRRLSESMQEDDIVTISAGSKISKKLQLGLVLDKIPKSKIRTNGNYLVKDFKSKDRSSNSIDNDISSGFESVGLLYQSLESSQLTEENMQKEELKEIFSPNNRLLKRRKKKAPEEYTIFTNNSII